MTKLLRSLCDVKCCGYLTFKQFALALWLLEDYCRSKKLIEVLPISFLQEISSTEEVFYEDTPSQPIKKTKSVVVEIPAMKPKSDDKKGLSKSQSDMIKPEPVDSVDTPSMGLSIAERISKLGISKDSLTTSKSIGSVGTLKKINVAPIATKAQVSKPPSENIEKVSVKQIIQQLKSPVKQLQSPSPPPMRNPFSTKTNQTADVPELIVSSDGDELVKAIFDYKSDNPDDLSFNVGQVIKVHRKGSSDSANEGEWWYGEIEDSFPTSSKFRALDKRKKLGYFPSNYVSALTRAKALYRFQGENEQEISFNEGDILWILNQEMNSDWWIVKTEGNLMGYAPANYMEIVKTPIHSRQNSITKALIIDNTEDDQRSSSSWANQMEESFVMKVSVEERKRQEAIFELIFTEQKYVRSLMALSQIFIPKFKMFVNDYKSIFGNTEEILYENSLFLDDLEKHQRKCQFYIDSIAPQLLKFVEKLQIYKQYCTNQKDAIKTLQEKRHEDKRIADFLKDCLKNPQCRGLDLTGFLLEPMQRLARYPLLIKQVFCHFLIERFFIIPQNQVLIIIP